jgi:glucose-6-phosphate isomerase
MEHSVLFPKEITEQESVFFADLVGLDCFSIVNSKDNLKFIENPRLAKWMSGGNFIIFGTGGSSLGGQCIRAISRCKNRNVKFVSNLDPHTLHDLFSKTDLTNVKFLCISKSGETLETICQTLLAVDFVKSCPDIEERFVVITENKPSSLREIADKFNFLCLDHPKTIGGRFSVFSIVGMLPAVLCGIKPDEIIEGGRKILNNFGDAIQKIKEGASFIVNSMQHGFTQHVSFIYSDKLSYFGAWLAQLYAESTGKSGGGITPITAMGSADQHSQLQLYLDGNDDKCFTFFWEKQNSQLQVPPEMIPQSFSYLNNNKISDIVEAQYRATLTSIAERGFNVRKIEIPNITPEVLGSLFMHFMLEVASVCKMVGINPFDQPAVERGKIITKNLLGATT